MNTCSTVDLYDTLQACPGQPVLSGIRNRAWAIQKANLTKIPEIPDLDTANLTMDKLCVIEEDFGLAADKVFITIDLDETQSNVKSASQGEGFNTSFLNSITLKYPGNNEAAAGFCRLANADDLLYVVQQRDGKFRILGNKMFRTVTKPSQDSGQAVTDASGTTLEISVTDLSPAPFYLGKLKTDQGTIDCKTGEFVEEAA